MENEMQEYQLNSFQKWARKALFAAGITDVAFTGNWLLVNGETVMSVEEVRHIIASN